MADEGIVAAGNDGAVDTSNPAGGGAPKAADNQPKPGADGQPPKPAGAKGSDDHERALKGIQADLAKERKARQQFERDLAAARAEVESERRRVAALAGVHAPSPEEAELEEIRARAGVALSQEWLLKQLGLTKEEIEEMKAAKEDRARLADIEQHYWGKHGSAMVNKVTAELAKEYGGELSKRQIDKITQAYIFRAQQDPEFLSRHENGDETLVTEFAKEWLEDWFEPAKRKITATEASRFRPVPDGKGRSIVNHGEKKIDVNDPKAVEDILVAGFRERGGEFGRRR